MKDLVEYHYIKKGKRSYDFYVLKNLDVVITSFLWESSHFLPSP